MKGDKILIKPIYYKTAEAILSNLPEVNTLQKYVITIGGESGSGKSVAAFCLQELLVKSGIATSIIHQDDYFYLPPKTNHAQRLQQIEHVGLQEVNLLLLQGHVNCFKTNKEEIQKPLIDYNQNIIEFEKLNILKSKVLIVEGTYSLCLQDIDLKIFMNRTYKETILQRMERGREAYDEFIEKVLSIEHSIIAPMKKKANLIVNKDYQVEVIID